VACTNQIGQIHFGGKIVSQVFTPLYLFDADAQPDKNQGNIEEATTMFKMVQSAWEVLSDEHERSWYDAHREQILRGQRTGAGPDAGADVEADELDLMHFFNPACFEGFTDEPNGFFAIYAGAFESIDELEEHAAASEGSKFSAAPCFGDSQAPWSQVKQFYAHWSNFISVRSFSWKDKWNLAEGPNRLYRRAMEKENKKERDVARREYVNDIRSLVEFVRRRDPRWAAARLKQKQDEQAKADAAAQAKKQSDQAKAEQRQKVNFHLWIIVDLLSYDMYQDSRLKLVGV
jgi:DnaJ family protein A protein 5